MPGNFYYRSKHWLALRARRLKLDSYRCTVPGCGQRAVVVEHTVTRPYSAEPCEADRIELLRSLCRMHDNQVKERRRGEPERRSGGRFTIKGCDVHGWPLDPARR